MNEEPTRFALSCRDANAPAPVLTSVRAIGRLDAVLFELTLRQTYRNTSQQVLEVVYTFPLPPQAVLLGFASELNGQRQQGTMVARRKAERRYEASLQEGDAPVLLEAHAGGLHTANIGNLAPGDEVVLEARFAQLLGFEQGRLRVSVPTTIAPRYGSAERSGLQPQQVPLASLDAAYPLALSLTIGEALTGATVECPMHRFAVTRSSQGATQLDLEPGAWLDRDVVVIVTPREPRPSLLVRADDTADASAAVVMMAALQPPVLAPRERISIKVLVDCSGSMGGDSIASARAALRGVAAGLSERDRLSLSRFGSTVEHPFAAAAKPQALRQLRALIDGIDADLGGTEMERALRAVLELPCSADGAGADVLLITDGEIWPAAEMREAARRSAQRVFAIGVGSSPAEGVLRSLAEATGGACEFATPGEALEAAAQRMLHRMRQPLFTNARLDWGCQPAWTCGPAPGLFGGDTVIALAGFANPPQARAIRLLADDAQGRTVELARGEADAPCAGDTLARIAAARRLGDASQAQALELALRYQLLSAHTHCILVHRRDEADRTLEAARLQRVSPMLAAGWGASSTLMGAARSPFQPMQRTLSDNVPSHYAMSEAFGPAADLFSATACRLRPRDDREPATLAAMARAVAERLAHGVPLPGLAAHCAALSLHADARQAIDDALQLGLTPDEVWLLLAHWANVRANGLADEGLAALLQPLLASMALGPRAGAHRVFDRLLGGHPIDSWLERTGQLRSARLPA